MTKLPQWEGPGDRGEGLARLCLGWPGPSSPPCCGLPAGSRLRWWCGLAHVLFSGWVSFPFLLIMPSWKRLSCHVSPVSGFYFCNHINSTGISGNMSVAKVYVCRSVCFSPFWSYVGGINVSITTANTKPSSWAMFLNLSWSLLDPTLVFSQEPSSARNMWEFSSTTSTQSEWQYQEGTLLCIIPILDTHMFIMSLCISYSLVSKH
jgi:hypothetical protein